MKNWLLEFLDCSFTRIRVSRYSRDSNEIFSGIIFCDTREYFIRRGIPILLNPKKRRKLSKLRGLYEALPAAPWKAIENSWVKHMRLIHFLLLQEAVKMVKDKRREINALALGCGWGWEVWALSKLLGSQYEAKIIGIDIASKPLKLARKILAKSDMENIEFCVAAAEELPFKSDSFHVVLGIFGSLDHSEEYPKIFLEVSRVLKRDGIFVFTVLNRFSLDWLLKVALKPNLLLKTIKKMREPFTRVTIPLPDGGSVRIPTHYYTPSEAFRLLKLAKLTPIKVRSIFSLLPMNFKKKKFSAFHRVLHKLDYYGSSAPLLKYAGRYLGIIAKKSL